MAPLIHIVRYDEGNQGTRGLFLCGSLSFHSLELPDRGNAANISRIPAGEYVIKEVQARHAIGGRRDLYLVLDVPGRGGILVHAGTWAGDRALGYRSSVYGCILIGKSIGTYLGQKAIFNTRAAVREFMEYLDGKSGRLLIQEVGNV